MALTVERTSLEGLLRVSLQPVADERGFFVEAFNARTFEAAGIPTQFVQDNQSRSKKGVIRGLHFQWDPPLGKLVRVGSGRAFVAFADIRKHSPSFRKICTETCGATDGVAFFAPPGIAAGFCALEDNTDIQYKYSTSYNPRGEGVIRFDDTELNIMWPVAEPLLSERDRNAPSLKEWLVRPESDLWK